MRRRAIVAVVIILILLALPAGWYLGSPLFISKSVQEEFPLAANALVPADQTRGQVEQEMAKAAQAEEKMREEMPHQVGEPTLLRQGMFQGADSFHKGEGIAKVYRIADGSRLLRLEGFKVTNGPDLYVILTKHPSPKGRGNVQEGGYVELARLKGNIGDQNYPIPEALALEQYQAAVIYCKAFHVLFSVASFAER